MQRKKLISIVTPCYNEELNVHDHFRQVSEVISPYSNEFDFEHIYTDNCSFDMTFEKLSELADAHPNVRIMRFSNNIGANRAIFMGLKASKGDAVVLIQADLQDPPAMINTFIEGWKEGYEVVYGKIKAREEGFILQNLRKLYYYLIDTFSDVPIPQGAGEFRITSRRVLNALLSYQEDDLYIRGAIARIGFKQKPIPYERQARHKGESSNNYLRLISYAINGFVSTSVAPIRLVSTLGFIFSSLGFLVAVLIILSKIFFPDAAPRGFTTLAVLVTFFAGLQLLGIGIIGEYLRKTYLQVLSRPLGFIEKSKNLDL
jgi:glycosyltransferase involved in cell wall biosynthesis